MQIQCEGRLQCRLLLGRPTGDLHSPPTFVLKERSLTSAALMMTRASDSSLLPGTCRSSDTLIGPGLCSPCSLLRDTDMLLKSITGQARPTRVCRLVHGELQGWLLR